MTLPISALRFAELGHGGVGLLGDLDGGGGHLGGLVGVLGDLLMLAPISSVPVATVATFLLTCSAAAEATLACAAVSSALDAICWLTAVSSVGRTGQERGVLGHPLQERMQARAQLHLFGHVGGVLDHLEGPAVQVEDRVV